MVLGDLSKLRVRADLDERNREKVFVGQSARIHVSGVSETFTGRVAAISPALVPAFSTSGGRRRPLDSVVEVLVELMNSDRLMPGMQVDVFFLAADTGVVTSPITPPLQQQH